jgi:hypothetical protein
MQEMNENDYASSAFCGAAFIIQWPISCYVFAFLELDIDTERAEVDDERCMRQRALMIVY